MRYLWAHLIAVEASVDRCHEWVTLLCGLDYHLPYSSYHIFYQCSVQIDTNIYYIYIHVFILFLLCSLYHIFTSVHCRLTLIYIYIVYIHTCVHTVSFVQFVCVESLVTAVVDMYPKTFRVGYRRELLILGMSVVSFMIGLIMLTEVILVFDSGRRMNANASVITFKPYFQPVPELYHIFAWSYHQRTHTWMH